MQTHANNTSGRKNKKDLPQDNREHCKMIYVHLVYDLTYCKYLGHLIFLMFHNQSHLR